MRDSTVLCLSMRALMLCSGISFCVMIPILLAVSLFPLWYYTSISQSTILKPPIFSQFLNNIEGFNPSDFTGYVDACATGCSGTFREEQDDWCGISRSYPHNNTYESLCNTFTTLNNGKRAQLVLLLFSCIGLGALGVFILGIRL